MSCIVSTSPRGSNPRPPLALHRRSAQPASRPHGGDSRMLLHVYARCMHLGRVLGGLRSSILRTVSPAQSTKCGAVAEYPVGLALECQSTTEIRSRHRLGTVQRPLSPAYGRQRRHLPTSQPGDFQARLHRPRARHRSGDELATRRVVRDRRRMAYPTDDRRPRSGQERSSRSANGANGKETRRRDLRRVSRTRGRPTDARAFSRCLQ